MKILLVTVITLYPRFLTITWFINVYNDNFNGSVAEANYTVANRFPKQKKIFVETNMNVCLVAETKTKKDKHFKLLCLEEQKHIFYCLGNSCRIFALAESNQMINFYLRIRKLHVFAWDSKK